MSNPQTSAKDFLKYKLNVLSGEFDLVQEFNPDRLISHELNAAGLPFYSSEPLAQMGPFLVFDNNGNVVST